MSTSFTDFGLLPSIQSTLKEKLLFRPTEIQSKTIPLLLQGSSLVGVAETGSGKTLSYALPVLHLLKSLENSGDKVTADSTPRAVVMVPTRELGEQVSKVFKKFTHDTRLRVRPALGGMDFEQARRNVAGPFEVLLATPGRLLQLMQRRLIDLSDVRILIFDEADQMLDNGFLPDSDKIVSACPPGIPMALFSATVSKSVQELMNELFADAQVLRTVGSGKVVSSLATVNRMIVDGQRWPIFEKLLTGPQKGKTIIFTNTREQCDRLVKEMTEKGFPCAIYRGEMDKKERRANLKKFMDGKIELLISTDLAARGLDLEGIERVINYHLPKQMDNYLHRVGRTARAGRPGTVINLVTERDVPLISQLDSRLQFPDWGRPSGQASGTPGLASSVPSGNRSVGSKAVPKTFASKKLGAEKPSQRKSSAPARFKK